MEKKRTFFLTLFVFLWLIPQNAFAGDMTSCLAYVARAEVWSDNIGFPLTFQLKIRKSVVQYCPTEDKAFQSFLRKYVETAFPKPSQVQIVDLDSGRIRHFYGGSLGMLLGAKAPACKTDLEKLSQFFSIVLSLANSNKKLMFFTTPDGEETNTEELELPTEGFSISYITTDAKLLCEADLNEFIGSKTTPAVEVCGPENSGCLKNLKEGTALKYQTLTIPVFRTHAGFSQWAVPVSVLAY